MGTVDDGGNRRGRAVPVPAMSREWVLERFFLIAETPEGFQVQDPQTGGSYFIPRGAA